MEMKIKKSKGRILFEVINFIIIAFLTISCLVPIINILAYSFSSSQAIIENRVSIIPQDFTLQAYKYVLSNARF